jgi:hypothetical protein
VPVGTAAITNQASVTLATSINNQAPQSIAKHALSESTASKYRRLVLAEAQRAEAMP